MPYSEPNYWIGGPAGESPTAAGLNKYSDNLAALETLLEATVNHASNTKNGGSHPLVTFSHRLRWLAYISETKDATGTIVGREENEAYGEAVRLPYAAVLGFYDLDSIPWMVQGRQYVVGEVDYATEVET